MVIGTVFVNNRTRAVRLPVEVRLPKGGLGVYRPRLRPARAPAARNCKRPETLKPTRFRRPGAQGHRDRLRQSFSEPRFGG